MTDRQAMRIAALAALGSVAGGAIYGWLCAPLHYRFWPLNFIFGAAVGLALAPVFVYTILQGRRPLARVLLGLIPMAFCAWIARRQSYLSVVMLIAISGYLEMCFICWAFGRHVWPGPRVGVEVCGECGYSLAGLRSARCPECGRATGARS